MKFCKDCRWALGATEHALCDHPKAHYREVSPVTGRAIEHRWQCGTFRMAETLWPCGPEGKLWEPKDGAVGFVDDAEKHL